MTRATEIIMDELRKAEAVLNCLRHKMEAEDGIGGNWYAVTAAEDIVTGVRRMMEGNDANSKQ